MFQCKNRKHVRKIAVFFKRKVELKPQFFEIKSTKSTPNAGNLAFKFYEKVESFANVKPRHSTTLRKVIVNYQFVFNISITK